MPRNYLTTRNLIIASLMIIVVVFAAVLLSDGDPDLQGTAANQAESTEAPTEVAQQPTDNIPTEEPPTDAPPTELSTDEPATDVPPTNTTEPTSVPTNTLEPTDIPPTNVPTEEPPIEETAESVASEGELEVTEEVSEQTVVVAEETAEPPTLVPTQEEQEAGESSSEIVIDEAPQGTRNVATQDPNQQAGGEFSRQATACQMSITDAGDTNPFTFDFAVINVQSIASFAWVLGDGTTSTAQTLSHTYSNTGTFNIQLTCDPTNASLADIVLTGSISVASVPVSSFYVLPGSSITSDALPVVVTMVNNSSGGGLTYAWQINGTSPGNGSYSDTSTQAAPSFNLPAYGNYEVILTATDGAGTTSISNQIIQIIAPAPTANFTLSEAFGTLPLSVTFAGVDEGTGPITSWDWEVRDSGNGVLATFSGQDNGGAGFTYAFNNIDTYSIMLTYTGPGGTGTVTRFVDVVNAGDSVTADWQVVSTTDNGATGVEVCFENLSTGDVRTSEWVFDVAGAPSTVVSDNSTTICHVYDPQGTYSVQLTVFGATASVSSQSTKNIGAWRAVEASFNASADTILQGQTINLTDTSSGNVLSWEWDLDGDGQYDDSTAQNPTNVSLNALGVNVIRLRVTGPGNIQSTAEMNIVLQLLEITCGITGNVSVLPNTSSSYTANIGNDLGRAVTYNWTVTPSGAITVNNATSSTMSVDWTTPGSYIVTLNASTADGSSCSETTTVQVEYQSLTCSISSSDPTPVPDGSTVTYTATVGNLEGRTPGYDWFVNGAPQGVNSTTFTYSWSADAANQTVEFRAEMPDDSDDCSDSTTFDVEWPPLSCNLTGTASPYPNTDPYTYNIGVTGDLAGRTLSYQWYLDGATVGTDSASHTTSWNTPDTMPIRVVVTPSAGTGCEDTINLNIAWPSVTCDVGLTSGNTRPDGNNNTFTGIVNDPAGRTYTYEWTINGTPQGNNSTSQTFSTTDETNHVITFTATSPDGPVNCSSSYDGGGSSGGGNGSGTYAFTYPTFSCNVTGNNSPLPQMNDDPARTYTYGRNLSGRAGRTIVSHTWTVTDSGGATFASGTGNNIDVGWAWNELGNYTVGLTVVVQNANGTLVSDDCNRGVTVGVPSMTCSVPVGDTTPVIGENATYTTSLTNDFSRDTTHGWTLYESDGAGGWNSVTTGSTAAFSYTFNVPDQQYRLVYDASVIEPSDNCNSELLITAASAGVDFSCDAGPTGNLSPDSSATPYNYTVTVDNSNLINLQYRWVLLDETGTTELADFGTENSAIDSPATVASPSIPGTFTVDRIGNYVLRVYVDDADDSDTPYACQLESALELGTFDASFSYTNGTGGAINNSLIEEGQTICFTNDSTVSHGSLSDVTFDWALGTADNSLNVATVNNQDVGCFSFDNPGTYTVTLNGAVNSSSTWTDSHAVTFTVYGTQSLAIDYTDVSLAPAFLTFTGNGVNITGNYRWFFYDNNGVQIRGPIAGQSTSQSFNAGQYRAELRADGPLGTNTATVDFDVLGGNDIRAAFVPSRYGGEAPMQVCFTDRSFGSTINSWTWTFGNGETLSYTDANVPAQICTTYTVAATVWDVQLVVSNGTTSQSATNQIRTYNAIETQSSFSITPQGGGRYCFSAIISNGVTVTNWDFGDGTTINTGNLNSVCHTYNGVGTFLVSMDIQNPPATGRITRPLTPTTGPVPTPPAIVASASCDANSVATFSIQNTGGDMSTVDNLTIVDQNGTVVLADSFFQLASGQSTTYTVNYIAGSLTLSTIDTSASASTNCAEPPRLTGTAVCDVDGTAVFTITNASSDTSASQSYTVTDSNGTVDSGTLTVAANNGTAEIRVNNNYNALTFSSSGAQGPTTVLSLNTDCDEPPVLVSSSSCAADGLITFNIQNTSGDTASSQPYTITDNTNVTLQSGTLTVATGATETFTISVIGEDEPLTFASTGTQGTTTVVSETRTCDEPPILTGSATCDPTGDMTFTINNTSEDTASNQAYTITDSTNASVQSGTLTVAAGGTESFTINIIGVSDPLTFASSDATYGTSATVSVVHDCDEPPILNTTSTCGIDGLVTFTVDNSSANIDANQPYEIRDSSNQLVSSGTLSTVAGSSDDFAVNVIGWDEPLTFTTSDSSFGYGSTATTTGTQDCDEPPILSSGSACSVDGAAIYTIVNNSEDTSASQSYTVSRGGNIVDSGMITVAPAMVQTIIVQNGIGLLTLTSSGAEGSTTQLTVNTDCAPAVGLYGDAVCSADGSAIFTINNGGLDVDQVFEVVDSDGSVLSSGQLTLAQNGTTTINVPNASGTVSFATTGTSTLMLDANCEGQGVLPASIANPPGVATRFFAGLMSLVPGEPDSGLPGPEWEGVEMGGEICPDWIVYHTDQTGDWEIFRLGDLHDGRVADVNLTQGRGEGVVDMAPTRSPDAEWIAFTSNRDDNWELYVAKVDNSIIRRVTYNTIALDIDPTWSPDGRYLAFETTRDGNWELYLFDLISGEEIRLTDDESNDINAFWSPDSERIVFQSDRSGLWQIYELEIATGDLTLLSDGTGNDHDPMYSFDDEAIVFRSFRGNNDNSVIYVMDRDGSNVERISAENANAMNHTWSADDTVIAYQSDLDGDLDIYAWEAESGATRLITDNDIPDYAPTWICDSTTVVFTSDVTEDPNIFNTPALPIDADPILVDEEANQMTDNLANDVYPESSPSEENASREGDVPPRIGD